MIKLKDILNEGSKNPANIKAYYEALCKNEKVTPLPVKFGCWTGWSGFNIQS